MTKELATLKSLNYGMISADEVGKLLDRGLICVKSGTGNWWRVRRNGATKTWKTRIGEFRIPVKAGFRDTGEINQGNLHLFACTDDLDALGIKHT